MRAKVKRPVNALRLLASKKQVQLRKIGRPILGGISGFLTLQIMDTCMTHSSHPVLSWGTVLGEELRVFRLGYRMLGRGLRAR